MNEDEAHAVAGMLGWLPADDILTFSTEIIDRYDLDYCVITMGAGGALASGKSETVYSPAFVIELQDPIGSGDAFSAGFIDSLLDGRGLGQACRRGNALGALVARQKGGTQAIALEDLEKFLTTARQKIPPDDFKEYLAG